MGKTLRNFRARPVKRAIRRLTKKAAYIEVIGEPLDLPVLELRERGSSAVNASVCDRFARRIGPRIW